MTGTEIIVPTGTGFDYSVLDAETADAVMRATESIKHRKAMVVREIIGVGSDLLKVKDKLGHGLFGRWLAAEFDFDERTARRYMSVAETLNGKTDIVSDLSATTLYALASSTTPISAREDVVMRLERGERLTGAEVIGLISTAKVIENRTQIRRRQGEARKARLKPKSSQALKRQEKVRQKVEEVQLRRDAAGQRLLALILNRAGDLLPEIADLLDDGSLWRLREDLQREIAKRASENRGAAA